MEEVTNFGTALPAGAQNVSLLGDWLVYTNEHGNLVSFPAPDTDGEGALVRSIIDLTQSRKHDKRTLDHP